jgi:hypothetical protein
MTLSWPVIGTVATVVGLLIGIGVGWGTMRSLVASLKGEVAKLQGVVTQVTTHDADLQHLKPIVADLVVRMVRNEVDIATLKALSKN